MFGKKKKLQKYTPLADIEKPINYDNMNRDEFDNWLRKQMPEKVSLGEGFSDKKKKGFLSKLFS